MLRRISISNYVLIDSLELELPQGLTIITGETGAGKSILLGAVSLLLGARADLSVLGDPSRNCVVEAEFSVSVGPQLEEVFNAEDIAPSGEIVLRRVITPSGRSRSFLNDEPVGVRTLSRLSAFLVDIHSQHQHLRLADPAFLLSVVDMYADNRSLAEGCRAAYREYSSLLHSVSGLEARVDAARRDRDYRQYQFDELTAAALRPGETEELEQEVKVLSSAEEIRSLLADVLQRIAPEEGSLVSGMKEAVRSLDKASSRIESYAALRDRLDSCRLELKDILEEVSSSADAVVVSPERLEAAEQRLSFLWKLMEKHGCRSVDELVQLRDSVGASLDSDSTDAEELSRVRQLAEAARVRFTEACARLSESRKKAAVSLSEALQKAVRSLEMPRACISVEVSPASAPDASGADRVRFLFSSSAGHPSDDLGKVASGGELSRVMLCIKAMMAGYVPMATMVFDEIDTGVSGSVADKMGAVLEEMGRSMQVLAITHLPQVASKGGAHLLVSKHFTDSGRAVTKMAFLDQEGRVREIARLLSGSEVTEAALGNARALLGL